VHARAARPLAQEDEEGVDGIGGPLGVHLDGAIVSITNPAEHPELKRPAPGRLAEADTLDGTANRNAQGKRL
jgi:hypothetical protein